MSSLSYDPFCVLLWNWKASLQVQSNSPGKKHRPRSNHHVSISQYMQSLLTGVYGGNFGTVGLHALCRSQKNTPCSSSAQPSPVMQNKMYCMKKTNTTIPVAFLTGLVKPNLSFLLAFRPWDQKVLKLGTSYLPAGNSHQ